MRLFFVLAAAAAFTAFAGVVVLAEVDLKLCAAVGAGQIVIGQHILIHAHNLTALRAGALIQARLVLLVVVVLVFVPAVLVSLKTICIRRC